MTAVGDGFDDGEITTRGIVSADILQQYVDTFASLVDECRMHFSESGLSATAVDPANVAMVDADLSRGAFEAFDSPGEVRIGVALDKLDDKLGSANSDDLVEFGLDMETRHLRLRYRTVEHKMALIDPDSIRQEPEMPDLELPNFAEIHSDDLQEARKNVALVTDHLWIRGDDVAGEGELRFVGEGDTDRTILSYVGDDLERDDIHEDTESCFSVDYIEDMDKPIPSGVVVGIEFGDEFPMVLSWSAFEETLDVTYSLAPRITSE